MVGKQFFSTVVLIAMLSSVSSYGFFQPRVSRTPDAIIVDFAGLGFSPFPLGKGYSQIADPEYIPLNPYPMTQYQPTYYNAWPFFRQAPAACGKGALATPTSRSSVGEKIIGTDITTAKKNTWTFLVAVSFGGTVTCAGTLLRPTKVLTAASCFEKMSLNQISTATVSIGALKSDQSDAQMTRRVSQVVINSQYNSATFANDIAILTLDMPVVFSKTVGSVCLPTVTDPFTYDGQNAMIIGWGQAAADVDTVIDMQQGLVAVGYNTDCKTDLDVGKFMTGTTFCLTDLDGSVPPVRFTCQSDVGGPVLVNIAPNVQGTNAIWTQIGINSMGGVKDDCSTNSLKTNAVSFLSWIATYNV